MLPTHGNVHLPPVYRLLRGRLPDGVLVIGGPARVRGCYGRQATHVHHAPLTPGEGVLVELGGGEIPVNPAPGGQPVVLQSIAAGDLGLGEHHAATAHGVGSLLAALFLWARHVDGGLSRAGPIGPTLF